MVDATARIKNLSIALEALSRINNEGSPDLYDAIASLLREAIDEQIKENNPAQEIPARPANTATVSTL